MDNTALPADKARSAALRKYRLIQPFLQQTKTLIQICQEHQLALRTVKYWVQCYRKAGLAGLIRQPRRDKGKKRCMTPDIQQLIEGLHLLTAIVN